MRPVQRQEVHLLQKRRLEVSTRTEEWWCRMSNRYRADGVFVVEISYFVKSTRVVETA